MGRDRKEPAFQRTFRVVVGQAGQKSDERLLDDVLGRGPIPDPTLDERQESTFIPRDQVRPGVGLPGADSFRQDRITFVWCRQSIRLSAFLRQHIGTCCRKTTDDSTSTRRQSGATRLRRRNSPPVCLRGTQYASAICNVRPLFGSLCRIKNRIPEGRRQGLR